METTRRIDVIFTVSGDGWSYSPMAYDGDVEWTLKRWPTFWDALEAARADGAITEMIDETRGKWVSDPFEVFPILSGKAERKRESRCDDPSCRGWFLNEETYLVERCDACAMYDSDEDAERAAKAANSFVPTHIIYDNQIGTTDVSVVMLDTSDDRRGIAGPAYTKSEFESAENAWYSRDQNGEWYAGGKPLHGSVSKIDRETA